MLEISIKHDEQEIQFLRVPDGIDIDAVVNLIRATLDNHRGISGGVGQPTEEFGRSSSQGTRKRKLPFQDNGEPIMTGNARIILSAISASDKPVAEARSLFDIVKRDQQFQGDSIETVRKYLRDFEKAGWLRTTPDNRRELTPQGHDAAARYANRNKDTSNRDLWSETSS